MPVPKKDKYRLDFIPKSGIAKGWRVLLTHQNIEFHKEKYGSLRPELDDNDFIDKRVPEAIRLGIVYNSKKFVKNKKLSVIVFYKDRLQGITVNGKALKRYTRVVARVKRRKKIIDIITIFETSNINEENKCQQIKKI